MNNTDDPVQAQPDEEIPQAAAADEDPVEEVEAEVIPEEEAAADGDEGEKLSRRDKKAVAKAQAELAEATKKLADANDKYLRMAAEYDNFRRRSRKERESIYADVRADTITKLLPVYDNLSRAVQGEPSEEVRKGMQAILTQFTSILTGLGVTEIEAVGQKFDPNLHEALLHIDDEKYGEGEIVLELEKGFRLGDKVIRFSKVQVAN